jgi:hypothetical protein
MCCGQAGHHGKQVGHAARGGCGCHGHQAGSMFWSKQKRIEMLEHTLECVQAQAKDLEDTLTELKAEA